MEAIFNWDEISVFLDDYLKSVKKFLKGALERNKCDIEDILERKNPARVGWKMESISVLIDLLDDDEQFLGDVLENIKVRIMKNYLL